MRKHIMLALATVEHMRGESWGQAPIPSARTRRSLGCRPYAVSGYCFAVVG